MRLYLKCGTTNILFVAIGLLTLPFSEAKGEERADSLEQLLTTNITDSSRVKILNDLCRYYTERNKSKALSFGNDALTLAHNNNLQRQTARAKNLIGIIKEEDGDYNGALDLYMQSLSIYKQIADTVGIGHTLSNIGGVYYYLSNYSKAREYFQKGLTLRKKLGDKSDIAGSLNNLGIIYYEQENYPMALEYYDRSLRIRQEIGDKGAISSSFNNIGTVYEARAIII